MRLAVPFLSIYYDFCFYLGLGYYYLLHPLVSSGIFSYLWYPLESFGIFSLPLISPLPTSFIYRSPNSKLSDGPLCLPFIPLSVYLFVFISKTAKLFFTFSLCPFPFPSNVNKPKKKARAHTHTHIPLPTDKCKCIKQSLWAAIWATTA